MNVQSIFGGIFLACCLTMACKNSSKSLEFEQLKGRWSVIDAERSNKKTGTFTGGYFWFQDNNVKTNLFGQEKNYALSLYQDSFFIVNTPTIHFGVQFVNDREMFLTTIIQQIPFKFKLQKNAESEY
ncbi:MAG TPA: hypothetical protein PK006_07080 [Saprospiraceae bacterium]|nr:hypothetical protein [Saprospiraceae bacterium]